MTNLHLNCHRQSKVKLNHSRDTVVNRTVLSKGNNQTRTTGWLHHPVNHSPFLPSRPIHLNAVLERKSQLIMAIQTCNHPQLYGTLCNSAPHYNLVKLGMVPLQLKMDMYQTPLSTQDLKVVMIQEISETLTWQKVSRSEVCLCCILACF